MQFYTSLGRATSGEIWELNLGAEFPNYKIVNYYFNVWARDGTFGRISRYLNKLDRLQCGKSAEPSVLCIDSQSVRANVLICEERGIDGFKKVNGRKRQYVVDNDGRLWGAYVHRANMSDSVGALPVLKQFEAFNTRLTKVLADTAYRGKFEQAVRKMGLHFEVAAHQIAHDAICQSEQYARKMGFVPEKTRWVVKRTIAWSNFFRRLLRDYDYSVHSSAAWMLLANISIIIRRISRFAKFNF